MSQKQAISGHPRGALPFAPEGFELNVNVGDHVTAGETIIARKVQQ